MGNTVSISCVNPACGVVFPLRYRSKNVERRGMYCSRRCYGQFTPKMNDVYSTWLRQMPAYESLRPREFMAVLILELNNIHGTWSRRAQVLNVSRLSFMHWVHKLAPEIKRVKEAMVIARGDTRKVVEILNKEAVKETSK